MKHIERKAELHVYIICIIVLQRSPWIKGNYMNVMHTKVFETLRDSYTNVDSLTISFTNFLISLLIFIIND